MHFTAIIVSFIAFAGLVASSPVPQQLEATSISTASSVPSPSAATIPNGPKDLILCMFYFPSNFGMKLKGYPGDILDEPLANKIVRRMPCF